MAAVQWLALSLVGTLTFGCGSDAGSTASGNALATGPIVAISSVEDLATVHEDLGAHYRLLVDLDLSGLELEPIGSEAAPFTGVFDGNGHTLSGFSSNRQSPNTGLFGVVEAPGRVEDLILTELDVAGTSAVGGLVGTLGVEAKVAGCSASGSVQGSELVGGLVGVSKGGQIVSSTAYGWVSAERVVGGLVGAALTREGVASTLTQCAAHNAAVQTASGGLFLPEFALASAGGLVGFAAKKTQVSDCSASGDVISDDATQALTATGGLIGTMLADGLVESSSASGDVFGWEQVGGLVGFAHSDITDCSASGDVSGVWTVGGLVGGAGSSAQGAPLPIVISDSSASGAVSSIGGSPNGHADRDHHQSAVGGMVGYLFPGTTIRDSTASGTVYGEGQHVGGLVGFFFDGAIERSYATGSVIGGDQGVGGLVGNVGTLDDELPSSISDSYASGSVAQVGPDQPDYRGEIGGLVGNISGSLAHVIARCHATGLVESNAPTAGGLIGHSSGFAVVSSSYWDIETTGQLESAGGHGKTTAEMTSQDTFVGWDFDTVWTMGPSFPTLRGM